MECPVYQRVSDLIHGWDEYRRQLIEVSLSHECQVTAGSRALSTRQAHERCSTSTRNKAPGARIGRVLGKKMDEEGPRGLFGPVGPGCPHLAGSQPASFSRLSSPRCCSLLAPSGRGSWSLHWVRGMSTCEHSPRVRGRRREGDKWSRRPPPPAPSALGSS